jgi:hypothetical protein
MFDNADVNRCPFKSLEIYDMTGVKVTGGLRKLISISDYTAAKGLITVDQEQWVAGAEAINLQLGMVTGFSEEPVYRRIVVEQRTACEASRVLRRTPNSKCTVDEETDANNEERGKLCSSMKSCYS